jgi:flotillin
LDLLAIPVLIIAGVVLTPLVLIALIVLLRGIKIAKPDEAIIVTSKQKKGDGAASASQRVVLGSRVFVKPFTEAYFKLSLRTRQLNVTATAQTKNLVTIKVTAVAVVKVGGKEDMIRDAAQRFLNQQDEIERITEEVLSGSVRSIIGELTVDEIITNRAVFQEKALSTVRDALEIQGLEVDTLQIKEIDDDNGYIQNLSRAESARVLQIAKVAEAESNRVSEQAQLVADQAVAEQQRSLDLRKAEIRKETDRAQAEAAAAAPLADAIAQQEVITQQEQTAQKRVGLRKQELDAEVNAKADADAYKTRKDAEAAAAAAVATAQADRDRRVAAADALKAEGDAEAHAIRVRGEAEAGATSAKAAALQEHSAALLQQQIIERLPDIIRAASEPLSAIRNMTVISSDGNGAGQVGQNVASQLATSTQIVKDLTGIDMAQLINGAATGAAAGRAAAQATAVTASTEAADPGVVSMTKQVNLPAAPAPADATVAPAIAVADLDLGQDYEEELTRGLQLGSDIVDQAIRNRKAKKDS